MDSAISNESLLQADQSSGYGRKLNLFISLTIIFTIIITAIISIFAILKHNIDSQSLAANPSNAIRSICHSDTFTIFTDDFNSKFFDSQLCIKSLSSLAETRSRTNPSTVFALSLLAAVEQLNRTTSLSKALILKPHNPEDHPALWKCTSLLNTSSTHLTRSLTVIGVDPDENIWKDKKIAGMGTWITAAASDLETCLEGFKGKEYHSYGWKVRRSAGIARRYVNNCIIILENLDHIFNMFYPPIGSVLGSFLLTSDSFVCLGLVCSQFLLLTALFAVLLRLDRRK